MVRSVIALVVALSVAMLPAAGGIAAPEEIPSASELATSAHDCCDHDGMPADNVMKDCQAAAGCAAKCFSVCGMVVSSPLSHPQVTGAEPFFETKTFRPGYLGMTQGARSEEHTSELQSHLNLVCRLLLEKKNNITPYTPP